MTICCPKEGVEVHVYLGSASFPYWDINVHFKPTVAIVRTGYKITDNIFHALRVSLTHLDRWLAFFTKFPQNFKS